MVDSRSHYQASEAALTSGDGKMLSPGSLLRHAARNKLGQVVSESTPAPLPTKALTMQMLFPLSRILDIFVEVPV